MDKEKFLEISKKCQKTFDKNGIGTYKEKILHKVIKNYYEENSEYQEIKIGKYVADICKDKKIIEVQTRAFNKLYPKLEYFCQEYDVTVVYPINHMKWLTWVDSSTGEVTKRRKSPKVGNIYDSFYELYKIKKHLDNPKCHIVLLLIDIDEFRNLDGWSENKKRGSSREDRIPLALIDEINVGDFSVFIPDELPDEFSAIDYAKVTKTPLYIARIGMTILQYVKAIEVVKKKGNSNIYKKKW